MQDGQGNLRVCSSSTLYPTADSSLFSRGGGSQDSGGHTVSPSAYVLTVQQSPRTRIYLLYFCL